MLLVACTLTVAAWTLADHAASAAALAMATMMRRVPRPIIQGVVSFIFLILTGTQD
jgi:F420-0:gamma-glutamyl ligase